VEIQGHRQLQPTSSRAVPARTLKAPVSRDPPGARWRGPIVGDIGVGRHLGKKKATTSIPRYSRHARQCTVHAVFPRKTKAVHAPPNPSHPGPGSCPNGTSPPFFQRGQAIKKKKNPYMAAPRPSAHIVKKTRPCPGDSAVRQKISRGNAPSPLHRVAYVPRAAGVTTGIGAVINTAQVRAGDRKKKNGHRLRPRWKWTQRDPGDCGWSPPSMKSSSRNSTTKPKEWGRIASA